VTVGIWAMGLFVLTVLVRVALPIELGHARSPYLERPGATRAVRPRSSSGAQHEDIRSVRIR